MRAVVERNSGFVGLTCFCAVAVCAAVAVVGASSALAAGAHGFAASFGSSGAAAGELSLVSGSREVAASGVAVNAETHEVYVADTGNNRVDEFESNGSFVRAWGWGVQNGAEELQMCAATCRQGLAGVGRGQLDAPTFIAVDNDPSSPAHGDVYVAGPGEPAESTDNLVTSYTAEGVLVESWGEKGQLRGSGAAAGAFGQLIGLAVGSTGDLWVDENGTLKAEGAHLYEFGPGGTFEQECAVNTGGYAPQGLAVDSLGRLYFTENAKNVHRTTCGNAQGEGIVAEASISGFAIDPAQGDLYVDTGGSEILDIPPGCIPSSEGCAPANTFGRPELSGAAGVAVDSSTGVLYAANAGTDQIVAFKVIAEATVRSPSAVSAAGATLRGDVVPDGSELTRCRFEYGTSQAFGASVPCEETAGQIGTGDSPVEVHADVTGLRSGTAYDFRLRMSNDAADIHSESEAFTTLPTAVIEEAQAISVEPTTALLSAKINPQGMSATYHFEYDTRPYEEGEPAHGTSIPIPDAPLGSGSSGVTVSQQINGLTPNTTYYFRVVVSDINGSATGANQSFVYLPPSSATGCGNEAVRNEADLDPASGLPFSMELPDCRAYELVSPHQKNAALLGPILNGLAPALADNGDRVIQSSIQCFADAQSCTGDRASKGPPFEFARTSEGWQTTPLAPSGNTFELNSVWGYDADTDMVLYSAPIASHVTDEFYDREPGGALEEVGPIAEDQPYPVIEGGSGPVATADLSHVVYESSSISLWPSFDETHGSGLYEYTGLGSTRPLLIGVSGGQGSSDLVSACGTALGTPKTLAAGEAMSADGRVIYFTAVAPCAGGSGSNEHTAVPVRTPYARVDGELPDAHTVAIAQPQCGAGAEPDEKACREAEAHPAAAIFEGASEDGAEAIFSSSQQLTDSATENSKNLYMYDFAQPEGHRLIDLSAGDSSGLGPQVQGMMAISADGSHVYFVARGVLSAGRNRAGKEPVEGADNLYVYAGGQTRFIATLPGYSAFSPEGERPETEQWGGRDGPAANVTPNGAYLVFTSHGVLTADTTRQEGQAQVFRYDAESEELKRISIGERGFNDDGNQSAGEAQVVRPRGNIGSMRRDLSMSDNGSYIFFQSPAALTPRALNNVSINGRTESKDLAQNIYEWESDGKGGCEQESGCVHLISDGQDVSEDHGGDSSVELLGADTTGENVFFTTADPLVKQDTDTQLDIYDARVNGGFPAPAQEANCGEEGAGEACRATPGPAPAHTPLGSGSFSGAGNLLAKLESPSTKPTTTKPLTRAQLLTKALQSCRKKDKRKAKKRKSCEAQAKKKYGPKPKPKAKKNGKGAKKATGKGKRK